ncbi:MAG TPA: hypothetical protein VLG92_00575 [Candidatus Saccharimonadia bacterium]|nr:hypothetical protein [Candidatus Saccharimonadia bacterium]
MQPNQPHQPSAPPPQPPYHPPEYQINPNIPSEKHTTGNFGGTVQHPSGYYEVVPPPAQNNVVPSGHNPYEFIMNPNAAKKKPLGGNNAFLVRIALLLGGLLVLMIVIVATMSALGPKSSTPGLTAIAERQQEIIRIATNASSQTTGQDTANLITNINASVTSSQQQVIAYLVAHGTKLGTKVLALDKNPQTDTLLSNAANANNYDAAVTQTLTQQLITYEGLLQTTFKQTSSKSTKQLLQECYTSASKLLRQAKALPANSSS